MAEIAATTSRATDRLAIRKPHRKWSRQSSMLTIMALSLLGWVALGTALRHLLSL